MDCANSDLLNSKLIDVAGSIWEKIDIEPIEEIKGGPVNPRKMDCADVDLLNSKLIDVAGSPLEPIENEPIEEVRSGPLNVKSGADSELSAPNVDDAMSSEEKIQEKRHVPLTAAFSSMIPVPIVEIHDNDGVKKFKHRFDVVDEILLHPEVKNRKIIILSIIGEYRKGKSYFLGYCLRFMYANYASLSNTSKPSQESASNWFGDPNGPLKGFKGKSGADGDTKGILFWPDVFLHDTSDEKLAIILMDTQGIFETGSTADENAKIFGLSTLISSIQILNLKELMHENQIEYLEMATNLTKFISQMKQAEWKPFQQLLFLVRDWPCEGEVGYDGGESYLKKFFNTSSRNNTKAESVRKNIHESFDSIKCFLLNHPGLVVTKSDFNGEWGKLEENFNQNLKFLIESLLLPDNLNKKSILGEEVTGAKYRDYIHAYFEAFKATKLPQTENIFETMANNQIKAIIDELVSAYKISINKDVDFDREDFETYIDEKHDQAKAMALLNFQKKDKIEDPERVLKSQSLLMEEIEKFFETWRVSTIREHEMHSKYKGQLSEFSKEMAKDRAKIAELEEIKRQQIEENERMKKQMEEELKRQEEIFNDLNVQFNALTLKNQEKDEEMKKLLEETLKKEKEHEENQKQIQEANDLKLKDYEAEMEEKFKKMTEEGEKMKKQHEREVEKLRKAGERNQDKANKELRIQREIQKRKEDEERLQREKEEALANMLRKNFSDHGDEKDISIDILKSIANVVDVVSKSSLLTMI